MEQPNMVDKLLELCENLQDQTYQRDVIYDYQRLRSSCDLLLRNMIFILRLEKNNTLLAKELDYVKDNLVTVFSNLTSQQIDDIVKIYKLNPPSQ